LISHAARRALCAGLALASVNASAVLDVKGVDAAVDPCADFYAHVNKRWVESTRIPDDRTRWGVFDTIDENNQRILLSTLDEARRNLPDAATPQGKVVRFYASGMDLAAIEAAGMKPIEPLLARAASVSDAKSLADTLAYLHMRGIDAGFAFAVRPDAKRSEVYLAQVVQGGLGMPDKDYYFRDDPRSVEIRTAYVAHVGKTLRLAGAAQADATRLAKEVMDFETQLARASMNAVDRRDIDKTYNKMTVAELGRTAPGFPWREYFDALGARDLQELNVAQPKFAAEVAELAGKPAAWHAYLRWQVLRAASPRLAAAFANENFDFYERTVRGRKARPARSREVVEAIGGRYGEQPMAQALGMVFVEKAFPPESKARMQEMIRNIKAALADRLRAVEWMSDDTRGRALQKLDAMGVKIGYPDKWRDFGDADLGSYGYAENWMRAEAYSVRRDVRRIGRPVDRMEWFISPHIVNAFYNASGNEIVFPAGILQPPFFDARADDAVNYGAIGMVIGHEITHGFDDRGRRFDAKGNLTDWWTPEDARRYVERAGRVERQYNAYVGIEDIKVNGKLTLGENISDIGGSKIAYLALQRSLAGKPRERIDGLTPEQRFFMSMAQAWRSSYRLEMERLQLRTDAHSPPRFRVAGVIANMPEFSAAFACHAPGGPLLSEADRANIW
jgi:predicted metalloendopeptidase